MDTEVSTWAALVQAGGVVAFAASVWIELRTQRREAAERAKEQAARDERASEMLSATLEILRSISPRRFARPGTPKERP